MSDIKYRILKENQRVLNAGTDQKSWFTLDEARKKVNRCIGQIIVEDNGISILGEIF